MQKRRSQLLSTIIIKGSLSHRNSVRMTPGLKRVILSCSALQGRVKHFWPERWLRSSRSEEHTSELQSRGHLVCRLLLEKKNCRLQVGRHSYIIHDQALLIQ